MKNITLSAEDRLIGFSASRAAGNIDIDGHGALIRRIRERGLPRRR